MLFPQHCHFGFFSCGVTRSIDSEPNYQEHAEVGGAIFISFKIGGWGPQRRVPFSGPHSHVVAEELLKKKDGAFVENLLCDDTFHNEIII